MSSVYNKQIFAYDLIKGTRYDYSERRGRMCQYAFISPTNGRVTIDGEDKILPDNRTEYNYKLYKDCGFDVMLILGNDKYCGEDFLTSDLKLNLDLCEKTGLKAIIFDGRLHDLSAKNTSLIGLDKDFKSFSELQQYVKNCLAPYKDHPAFYGVTLYDEPRFQHLSAVGEITRAVKAVDERIFVHTCLLPYFASVDYGLLDFRTSMGESGKDVAEQYKFYIDTHLKNTGAKYIAYDNYPIFFSRGETCICFTYFHNLQMVSETAAKNGARIDLTIQTYADKNTEMRICDKDDISFQMYSALAFGAINVSYFTYFMFPTRAKNSGICQAIMDDYGNKILYDEVKAVNKIAQKLFAVTECFNYSGTNLYVKSGEKEPQLFDLVKRTDFDSLIKVKVTTPTLVNRLYDANRKVEGFMPDRTF